MYCVVNSIMWVLNWLGKCTISYFMCTGSVILHTLKGSVSSARVGGSVLQLKAYNLAAVLYTPFCYPSSLQLLCYAWSGCQIQDTHIRSRAASAAC